MKQRHIVAILMADAVGFTTRMAEDEENTLHAVTASLDHLQAVISLHDGRTVKTMGDGLLAEFASAADAVCAAAEFQRAMSANPVDGAMAFRVGIHMGDIFIPVSYTHLTLPTKA